MPINFPIIDTHVHFLDPQQFKYPWLDQLPQLQHAFGPDELNKSASVTIDAMVFVQCDCASEQALEETNWVTQLAKKDPRIQAIVAYAPLHESPEVVREYLEKLKKFPLVKGVRRLIEPEKDKSFCLQPNFIANVQMLAEFDMSFDICIKAHQLPAVIALVQQCPKTRFVLDHMGKPNIADHELESWKKDLAQLAKFTNVACKLSGLLTEADQNCKAKDLKPYVEHAIDLFPDSMMFGSDWPVVDLAGNYMRWIQILDELLQSCSETKLREIFYENAAKMYKITMQNTLDNTQEKTESSQFRFGYTG